MGFGNISQGIDSVARAAAQAGQKLKLEPVGEAAKDVAAAAAASAAAGAAVGQGARALGEDKGLSRAAEEIEKAFTGPLGSKVIGELPGALGHEIHGEFGGLFDKIENALKEHPQHQYPMGEHPSLGEHYHLDQLPQQGEHHPRTGKNGKPLTPEQDALIPPNVIF